MPQKIIPKAERAVGMNIMFIITIFATVGMYAIYQSESQGCRRSHCNQLLFWIGAIGWWFQLFIYIVIHSVLKATDLIFIPEYNEREAIQRLRIEDRKRQRLLGREEDKKMGHLLRQSQQTYDESTDDYAESTDDYGEDIIVLK